MISFKNCKQYFLHGRIAEINDNTKDSKNEELMVPNTIPFYLFNWPTWKADSPGRMIAIHQKCNQMTTPVAAAILDVVSLLGSSACDTDQAAIDLENAIF